jgi:Mn2+/Fe2+ NRAMP family transporter
MSMQPEVTIKSSSASWPDRIGVFASALCVVHCLLTPILISMSAVFAHFLPSDERVHRTLALLIALIGAMPCFEVTGHIGDGRSFI